MGILQKIFLTCNEATFLVSKKQETTISFMQNVQLKMHLYLCKLCALFNIQSNLLHHELTKMNDEHSESTILQLDEATKVNLQNNINTELEK